MSIYLLSDTFHEGVINLPQIKIVYRDIKLDLSSYDALIFSSKNSVRAINSINVDWKNIQSYAIGKPTAKEVKKLGGLVQYTSLSSYGNDFAKELLDKLVGKKVLFLRAKKVLSDLETILKNNKIDIHSEVVYETKCHEKIALHVEGKKNIFIFTSPSTVDCFFKHYKWQKNYEAVCIGDVTAKALPDNISFHISKIQTIKACIELSKTIIKQN